MVTLITLQQFAAFLAASVLITLAPGPDNLMILSLGVARGKKDGVAFGLGCALGCLNHTILATLGVSALIAASPLAFSTLKMIGGLYLVWLGIQLIRKANAVGKPLKDSAPIEKAGQLFTKGLVANAINPKVILFFLAFLPQFVDSSAGNTAWQIMQLGFVFTIQAALIFGAIGWFAGAIGERLSRNPGLAAWLDRLAGGLFVLLGAKLISGR